MTVYVVQSGLAEPEKTRDALHKYHSDIAGRVDTDIIGLTGEDQKIRRVVLSQETDVSDLETFLNASLSIETETE